LAARISIDLLMGAYGKEKNGFPCGYGNKIKYYPKIIAYGTSPGAVQLAGQFVGP